jgi:glutathione peroxidase
MASVKTENIYQFCASLINQKEISLAEYTGKVILIVNTASKCGLTPQYAGLQSLYEKYKEKDFVILGFPCDQFANQELSEDTAIESFCKVNYGVSFPIFSKIDVNGNNSHPIFKYLKNELPGFLGTQQIKWNFTKFLINREGKPVKRFGPKTLPGDIENDILAIL